MTFSLRAIPFRWMLPLSQIVICALILWPIRSQLRPNPSVVYQFDVSPAHDVGEPRLQYNLQNNLAPEDPAVIHQERITEARLQTPALLNLPVAVVALPYAIFSPTKNDWVPPGMQVRTWRAISWPFVGLIFWWVVGVSIDALFSARQDRIHPKVRWSHSVISLAALACGVMFLLLPFCVSADTDSPILTKAMGLAGGLWVLLSCSTFVALIIQRRLRHKIGPADTLSGATL
jgi:hypothetical protein